MIRRRPSLLLVLLATTAFGMACTRQNTAPQPAPEPSGVRVTASVFSGRPDPAWTLDMEQARVFGERVRALQPAPDPVEVYDGLGYRGPVARSTEAVLDGCTELRVLEGAAVASCPGGARYYADPGRALERWLLESSAPHLDRDTHRFVLGLLGWRRD